MNARDYKPNFAGAYFHSYNRGVNKSLIFLDDQDYNNFIFRAKVILGLERLPKRSAKGGIRLKPLPLHAVEVLCFCLMPNHFHFLAKQNQVDGLKMFFQRLCSSYSWYFNKKYKRSGHVFQGVYRSKNILEDNYFTQLTAYIHLNPKHPFEWKYSSLPAYLGDDNTGLVNPQTFLATHKLKKQGYINFFKKNYSAELLKQADLIFEED